MNKIFFELIRVAIGNQVCLSHTPSAEDWSKLYVMAKKQSLVGVCFAAVKKLQKQEQCPPEGLYLQWLGMAAKIQQRNDTVNGRCIDLHKTLCDDGIRYCILKGQGNAKMYGELNGLRQSGDIDVWVDMDRAGLIEYTKCRSLNIWHIGIKHASVGYFKDVEVEVHYIPNILYNPFRNKKLERWFSSVKVKQMSLDLNDVAYPDFTFNIVYQLIHIFRHHIDEGIGLRQFLDYYMLITKLDTKSRDEINNKLDILKSMGLLRFTGAVMYVLKVVFGMSSDLMICDIDDKRGEFLLDEVLKTGNFGQSHGSESRNIIIRGLRYLGRNLRFVGYYPGEVLFAPFWKVWHWIWRLKHSYLK